MIKQFIQIRTFTIGYSWVLSVVRDCCSRKAQATQHHARMHECVQVGTDRSILAEPERPVVLLSFTQTSVAGDAMCESFGSIRFVFTVGKWRESVTTPNAHDNPAHGMDGNGCYGASNHRGSQSSAALTAPPRWTASATNTRQNRGRYHVAKVTAPGCLRDGGSLVERSDPPGCWREGHAST